LCINQNNMKILTKKKQHEALKRILANAIIAYDAIKRFEDKEKEMDASNHIMNNLVDSAYFIGGADLMVEAGEQFVKIICKEE